MPALSEDLLAQAAALLKAEKKKPKQASLRRSISTAYYALFHFLIDQSVRQIVGASAKDEHIRAIISRRFVHSTMNAASKQFTAGAFSKHAATAFKLKPLAIPPALQEIAETFVDLLQERHDADYDLIRRFSKNEASVLVERAERAFAEWPKIATSQAGRFFLVWLLICKDER
jgi:uncharacterized protein (UPF0332 family)